MRIPSNVSQLFRYECIEIPSKTRLHLISYKDASPDLVSVSVTIPFGAAHLTCIDELGKIRDFPQGMAHFMEHFLFWLHLRGHLIAIENKYYSTPNAVVTYDKTTWGVKHADIRAKTKTAGRTGDNNYRVSSICEIIQHLLSVLISDEDAHINNSLIHKTVSDIVAEIGHRHNSLDYRMQLALLSSLYNENPVRYDMLGTKENLKRIDSEYIDLALKLYRSNIQSIVVAGYDLSDKILAEVEKTVSEFLHSQLIKPRIVPLAPKVEPLNVYKLTESISAHVEGDWALALMGLKLFPLQYAFPSQDELKRMFLTSYLAMNYTRNRIGGILSPNARIYLIGGRVEDKWFFWDQDDLFRILREFKENLLQKLHKYKRHFEQHTLFAFTDIVNDPLQLMKLCHAADLYEISLKGLIHDFESLHTEDLDRLLAELNDAHGNVSLVYTESYD